MPAPSTFTPPAQPANTPPTTAPSFFIPQASTTPPVHNLSESPVLSSPNQKGSAVQSAQKSTSTSPATKKKLFIGIGAVIAVLVLIGGGAALYLSRTNEDNRQQASTPSGSAQITLTPNTGTFTTGSTQQIGFSLNLTTTPVVLSNIDLSISFSGQVPSDLHFQPQLLQNFQPAQPVFTDSDTGKTLKITFSPTGTQGFSATTSKVNLGTLTFTAADAGQMNVQFVASESKVVLQQSGVDILRPPSVVAFKFESPLKSERSTNNEVISDASSSGNKVATQSAEVNLSAATVTPTTTPILLAQTNTTITPTKTPTQTPTPIKTPTLTPEPTTSRQSSLPAITQKPPVSGSVDVTEALIGSGLLLILSGLYLLPRKKGKVHTHH